MDTAELPVGYMDAGREFLGAIRSFGLNPAALAWAWDDAVGHHVLVLVTELFDFKGPLEISRILLRAYNTSITPKTIDPFLVRMHSDRHLQVYDMIRNVRGGKMQKVDPENGLPILNEILIQEIEADGLRIKPAWVIELRPARAVQIGTLTRRWRTIEHNLDRLAA